MMPRNYDTTNGLPFQSISEMDFTYDPRTGMPTLTFTEQACLRDADGMMHPIANGTPSYTVPINLTDPNPVPIYDPATGHPIPGMMMPYAEIFAAVYSIAHHFRVTQGM